LQGHTLKLDDSEAVSRIFCSIPSFDRTRKVEILNHKHTTQIKSDNTGLRPFSLSLDRQNILGSRLGHTDYFLGRLLSSFSAHF